MAKIKPSDIDTKEREKMINEFFKSIHNLDDKNETVSFFLGMFTQSEMLMVARRIQVAKLILNGCGYTEISRRLGVGSDTIRKIDKWINKGDEKYKKWISEIIVGEDVDQKSRKKYYSQSMLNKYPFHNFWNNLFD